MKLKHLMAGALLTFSLAAAAHVNECNIHIPNIMETRIIDGYDYAKAWQEVEKLDHDLKPREALAKVKDIRTQALKEKNYQQVSRAFIYIIDYSTRVEEASNWKDEIKLLRAATDDAPEAPKAFLNFLLARYYTYFRDANARKLRNRTDVEDDQSDDIETWSRTRLDREIADFCRKAVANPKATQAVQLDAWKDAVERYETGHSNTLYCKTLYDFIAWNVIDNYCANSPNYHGDFSYKDIELVSDDNTFINFKPKNEDTWSSENLRLFLYQELLRAHKNDKTPLAYTFVNVFRLNYFKEHSVNEDANKTYLKTMQNLKARYGNDPELTPMLSYWIAQYHRSNGSLKEAHDIAAEAYKKFPKSSANYGEACNTLARELELKSLALKAESIVAADTPFPMRLEYTNLPKVYLHIYKVESLDDYNHNSYDRTEYIKNKLPEVRSQEVALIDRKDYKHLNSEIIVEGLPKGCYVILGSNDKDFIPKKSDVVSYLMVKVTNIAVVTMTEKIGHRKFYVVDRTTGRGVSSAKITLYSNDKAVWDATTNSDGMADMDIKQINFRYWSTDVTVTLPDGDVVEFHDYFSYDEPDRSSQLRSAFFTDRKIYRPGQTVYYKVIYYNGNGKEAQVAPNTKGSIELRDVNYKVVAQKDFVANEFGSTHGEFTLPVGLANGRFTLLDKVTGTHYTFNVEEYKRPTFEVKLESPENEVKINDLVTVNGSAATYAGTKIASGKVRYEVTRIPEWRGWWGYNNCNEAVIETGETTTDDDGNFKVTFNAKPDVNAKYSEYLVYNYRVKVSVTDTNGETREATTITAAGYKSMFISVSMPSDFNMMDKAKLNESAVYCNSANGGPITADVTVKVSRLANYDKPRSAKLWQSCDNPLPSVTREIWDNKLPNLEYSKADNNIDSLAVVKTIQTIQVHCTDGEGKLDLSFLKKEGSGHYLVQIESQDREGRPVKYERRFTIFAPSDDITKVNKVFFSSVDKSSYEPGETATVLMGSALSGLKVRYQVQCGDDIIDSGIKTLDKSVEKILIPIKEQMRGGLAVKMFYVRNNHFANSSEYIDVPYTSKKLTAKFETFRDKLYPGDTEKWKIRITDFQNKAARAEFAATLFDASVNALASNYWYLNAFSGNSNNNWYGSQTFGCGYGSEFLGDSNHAPQSSVHISHPVLNWYGHSPRFPNYMLYEDAMMVGAAANGRGIVEAQPMLMKKAVMDEEVADYAVAEESVEVSATSGQDDDGEDFSNAEIRTNFAETAFFKPDIVTDYNGDLFVEFTVPQSITRWKMLGIAHTKDMAVGTLTNELVTNKDFSVIPNLPRFMRCGDKVEIPIKISNLGENDVVRGQIKMEVLDVETMRPLRQFKIWEPLQAFEVFKGKTEATKYVVDVPQYEKPVAIRIVGVSGNHSDGEQHIIPILTDKTLVTEALTLSVRGNETKTFEFKNWTNSKSTTAIDHSLTLEYSSNPAWYAVSSLPWLSQNSYDCFEQTFSKLFANSVSKLIIDNNPDIPTILAKWSADNSQVLTSPLLKNQELKSLLIDETPWAIDGDNETERMHNLIQLLDPNRIATENEKFIKKLADGQTKNGAWPWFTGMEESKWITQHIIAGFGKLRHIGVDINKDPRITQMIDRAIRYLDEAEAEYFERYVKKNNVPSYYDYQYLYMRSFFPEYKLTKAKEAYDYYLKYAKENWQKTSLYYQAVLCTVFKRTGNEDVAQKIIASFQDRAQRSDEFGMYFNENVNGFLWHENNIETQSLIVEAFQEMGMKNEVEELKIWLIKNRQSNRWATTKATTEACYAMFLCGNKIKATEPLCKIIIGGKTADTKNAEAGTGYFKQSWQAHEMDKKMAKITVANPNDHISYGAVYRQYFEDLDKVVAADNKLQIEKQMFLNAKDNSGNPVLREITSETEVHPGDKVTARFVIRTDRDLEYVHLKDMRAAGFEPLNVLSRTKYQGGMYYYESTKDASENFFIEHLNKGTYVFEYQLIAVHVGDFSNGIATIQCMYAPEFTAHSAGMRFKIVK